MTHFGSTHDLDMELQNPRPNGVFPDRAATHDLDITQGVAQGERTGLAALSSEKRDPV